MLGEGRARAGESLMKEQRVLVNETERNKFREASRLLLDFSEKKNLVDPVRGRLDVSVHERGGAADADAMRGSDDLLPLFGAELVAGEHVADLVVENFGGGAGKCVESVVAQHGKVVGERHAGEFDAVNDLHGREGVNVHGGQCAFYGSKDVAVVKRRKLARQAALNANFGGAKFPGFDGFLGDFFRRIEISVVLARAAAEGAEFASDKTDVGEINVAIHDIGNKISGKFAAEFISGDEESEEIVAFGVCEVQALFAREFAAV